MKNMKALLTLTLALSFAQASVAAVLATSKLNGQAVETQLVRQSDGHKSAKAVCGSSLAEVGRNPGTETTLIYFNADSASNCELLSVIHDADTLTLEFDMTGFHRKGDKTSIPVKIQILGDDDQIRRAEGICLSSVSTGALGCTTTPTFNAYGLLENTQLTLDLK